MRWWSWVNGTTIGLRISSRYLCAFKMPSIKCTCVCCPQHTLAHTITPPPPWATRSTTLTSANRSPTRRHTRYLPSALYSENRDSSVKRTTLQSPRRHRMWAFAHSSRSQRWTAVRSRPRWGRRACRWASMRQFLTVCAEIIWLCKPIVAAAVWVAGLRRSWRWRCWMCRSWAGVVTRGLRLWGRLDVLPNSLKCLCRWLMVDKWTFNSLATALVDIPAVSMPIARSLKPCDICGIVLCDKTGYFRVAFYCGQPKVSTCSQCFHVRFCFFLFMSLLVSSCVWLLPTCFCSSSFDFLLFISPVFPCLYIAVKCLPSLDTLSTL